MTNKFGNVPTVGNSSTLQIFQPSGLRGRIARMFISTRLGVAVYLLLFSFSAKSLPFAEYVDGGRR